jgi:hypothetical protein
MQPWHIPEQRYYHDNTECIVGQAISPERREEGAGGKQRCKVCERLNRAEAEAAAAS